jgi:hypothetical protein
MARPSVLWALFVVLVMLWLAVSFTPALSRFFGG